MKKIIVLILSVIMCFACIPLVACGGNTDPGWTTTGTLEKDADGNVIFDNVEIRLSHVVTSEDKDVLESLISDFNREYRDRISVIPNSIKEESFETDIAKRITNNNSAPDFIMSHQAGQKQLFDLKMLQPYDDVMRESGITLSLDDYSKSLSTYSKYGGDELYSVPCDAQSMMVLYNKKLLKACGYENLPSSHAELKAMAETVKNKGYTPIAWSASMGQFQTYMFITALMQNGVKLYDASSYRAAWASDAENLAAIKSAVQAVKDLSDISSANRSVKDILNDFLNDRSLFYVALPWNMKSTLQAYANKYTDGKIDAVSESIGGTSIAKWFAVDPEKDYAATVYGDAHFFAITRSVTDITKKAAICEFVKWFTSKSSVQVKWGETGHLSVCNKVVSDDAYSENFFSNNYVSRFYPDINKFACTGQNPHFGDLRTYLGQIVITALNSANTSSVDDIIKSNQDKYNGQIEIAGM